MTISGIHVEEDPERKSRNKIFLSTRFLGKFLSFFHGILFSSQLFPRYPRNRVRELSTQMESLIVANKK